MVFSSLNFLGLFLPAILACYFIVPARWRNLRNAILLVFSLFFYAYGEPLGIFVMLCSIAGNYFLARVLGSPAVKGRKLWLAAAVIFNLLIIGYFKYSSFLLANLNSLLGLNLTPPEIIMPIGISFFTFQSMSYVFDVYYGTSRAQRNIFYVALYISLFPQLVAGPIVRYATIENELTQRRESLEQAARGMRRFIVGLAKKMLLANTLGAVATEVFQAHPDILSTPAAWLGALAYTFQIFYDFAGYSDMAIGLGLIFGFRFPENFNYPYIARSITEFWRRWHMSLSSWFKDYVYIPLGGNRKGLPRQLLNILIVWLLTGLWHGAAWNFVLWGLYFAVILILEKLFLGQLLQKIWRPFRHLYALLLIIFGWVIFNADGLAHFSSYLGAMLGLGSGVELGNSYFLWRQNWLLFVAAALFSLPLAQHLPAGLRNAPWVVVLRDLGLLLLFLLSIMAVISSSFNPFIYFRF